LGEEGGSERARRRGPVEGIECCVNSQLLGEIIYVAGLRVGGIDPDYIAIISKEISNEAILLGLPKPVPFCILIQALAYTREYMLTRKNRIRNPNILLMLYIIGETQISNILKILKKDKVRYIYVLSYSLESCVESLKYVLDTLNVDAQCIRASQEHCSLKEMARLASLHMSLVK
jgi:hypothetical protein